MDRYCSYCSSKIFESDRNCPQCGAPTMNYIVGLDKFVKTEKSYIENRRIRNYDLKELGSFPLCSDIRIMSMGDSGVFNLRPRDIFGTLKTNRTNRTNEIVKMFQGQISLVPNLDAIDGNDISRLFASVISSIHYSEKNNLEFSSFGVSEFVRLSQTVSAWNGGAKTVVVGSERSLLKILPPDNNYRYNLTTEYKINFISGFYQTDVLMLPETYNRNNAFETCLQEDRIWMVSPTEGKLLKMVFEDESLEAVGLGLAISSTFGTMVV